MGSSWRCKNFLWRELKLAKVRQLNTSGAKFRRKISPRVNFDVHPVSES
jgi:hypothetical protein